MLETFALRYGLMATTSSSWMRDIPWTMSRRLPSGSLNILWMWVAVPTGVQIDLRSGSSSAGSRCAKTPISLPLAIGFVDQACGNSRARRRAA